MRWLLLGFAMTACARNDASAPTAVPSTEAVKTAEAPSPQTSVAALTPEEAWSGVLAALQAGDDVALARYATADGIASLEKRVVGEPKKTAFARWGKGWSAWEIRWTKREPARAEANLGPQVKEHGLVFVKTDAGWKLDRWTPGE